MFALSGFGHHFPILIYVYQRTEEELNEILYSGQGVTALADNMREPITRQSDLRGSNAAFNKEKIFGKENEGLSQRYTKDVVSF